MDKQKQNIEKVSWKSDLNKQTSQNLDSMLESIKNWNVSKEKMDHIVNYVLKLAEIESKYSNQKENIKKDVRFFIESSFWNNLYKHLWEYNVSKFDVDGQKGFDKEEEKNYSKAIWESISQIILLWGLDKFSTIHSESDSKTWFLNADKYIADKVNVTSYIFWNKENGKDFAEKLIQKAWNINEEELKKMQENDFHPTSQESWKELWILLAKEFWNGLEEVLRFLWNMPSGIVLLPRYTKYRFDANSDDEGTKVSGEIKLKELVEENSSLWLLELLWEKWIEMIKQLWKMMTSGKQWDIAMMMVTIAGLIAGGAGLVKFWLGLSRKMAVKNARLAWRESRLAWEVTSRATRNSLKSMGKTAKHIWHIFSEIDDVVSGGGIGCFTWAYSWEVGKIAEKTKFEKVVKYSEMSHVQKVESILEIFKTKWIEKNDILMKNIEYIILNYPDWLNGILQKSNILELFSKQSIESLYKAGQTPWYFFIWGKEVCDKIDSYDDIFNKMRLYDVQSYEIIKNNLDKNPQQILQIFEDLVNNELDKMIGNKQILKKILLEDIEKNNFLLLKNLWDLNNLDPFWLEMFDFFYTKLWTIKDTDNLNKFIELYKNTGENLQSKILEIKDYLNSIWKWEFFDYFIGLNFFSDGKIKQIGDYNSKGIKINNIKILADLWILDLLKIEDVNLYTKLEYINNSISYKKDYMFESWVDLNIEKFDKESFIDAFNIDPEMALLNIYFFNNKTFLRRSNFSSWQEYIITEIKERSKNNKNIIVKELFWLLNDKTISRQQFEQEQKQVLSSLGITINTNQVSLFHILKEWELKSIWEVWDDRNTFNSRRRYIESNLWISTDLHEKNMENVLYWWMVTEKTLLWNDRLWAAPSYNDWKNIVYIKLKNKKQDHILFCIDDSFLDLFSKKSTFSNNWLYHSQVDLELAAYAKVLQNYNWSRITNWIDYIEAHIFNGVKIKDIDGIYFEKIEDYNDYLVKFPQYKDLFHFVW